MPFRLLGALRADEHATLKATIALARALRDHGQHDRAALAGRYAQGMSPARVAPIALLHASARDARVELILADAQVVGDPLAWILMAALTAGAIAAAGWARLAPRDMLASGLDDVEAACQRLRTGVSSEPIAAAREHLYDDVRAAEQHQPLPSTLPAHRLVTRVAVFHLLEGTPFVDAIEAAVAHDATTLTGALIGASLGEAALPEDAVAALFDGPEGARWQAFASFGGDPPPPGPVAS